MGDQKPIIMTPDDPPKTGIISPPVSIFQDSSKGLKGIFRHQEVRSQLCIGFG